MCYLALSRSAKMVVSGDAIRGAHPLEEYLYGSLVA